jgi:hypothetical protein
VRRPATRKPTPEKTAFRNGLCLNLREYFDAKLQAAKSASPGARVVWPTLNHWCKAANLNRHTLKSWSGRYSNVKEALDFCAEIRRQMTAMDLPCVIFDSEVEP